MQLIPRRRLFVDRQIQGTLLFRIAVYWCFAVLTVCLLTLCVEAMSGSHPNESFLGFFAFQQFFSQYGVVIMASLSLVPIVMFDVLATSNRFVGPLYRTRHAMRALAAGNRVAPIKFRAKDYWQEVSEEFNLVAAYVEQLQDELAETKAALRTQQELEAAVPS